MTDDLSKYQRQTRLQSFGLDNQTKLSKSQVLIVGIGGLGIPVAQYLNAMGVGTLGIMDNDSIELHNLHRQVLYTEKDVGQLKVEIAGKKLKEQNSSTEIKVIPEFLNEKNALEIIGAYDLIVDATDNFATRYLINDACVLLNKPFVYGALHDFEGQVSVFNYDDGPTYRCLFPNQPSPREIPNCDENGVLGVLPGIIGSFQALEVVKVLTGVGEVLSGKLMLYDGLSQKNRLVEFKGNPESKRIEKLKDSYGFSACATDIYTNADFFLQLQGKQQLIDVRSSKEFNEHHLKGAIHIPLQELADSMSKIDFHRDVYFICQSGKRSERAAQMVLELHPSLKVFSIEGGMNQISALCP